MCKVHPTCNPASPPTTLKPPPTTLPGHTCDLQISLYRERTYDPQTSTYDNSMSHLPPAYPLVGSAPTTLKPPPTTLPGHTYDPQIPCRECAYDPQTPSTTLPGHTYTTLKSRTWRKRSGSRIAWTKRAKVEGRKNTNAGQ